MAEEKKQEEETEKVSAEAPVEKKAVAEEKPAAEAKAEAPKKEAPKKEEVKSSPKAAAKKTTKEKATEVESKDDPLGFSLDDDLPKPKIVKAKGSKNISQGIAHIQASFNNTIVSISDTKGNVIGWSSSGKCGFRGSKKSTAYVAQVVAQDACRQAMSHGLKEVEVKMKGPGTGRESAVRALQSIGLEVTSIRDVTPVPHNGCRLRKQRRV